MDLTFRQAEIGDLTEIVKMLADDFLGSQRELVDDPLPNGYLKAFREIDVDPNNELIAAELEGEVIGTLQLTFTPSISFQGGKRCTVESVRVVGKFRGKGVGREMMLWAIDRARSRDCVLIQLSTNNDRTDAHRFYSRLGFKAASVGMKLMLNSPSETNP